MGGRRTGLFKRRRRVQKGGHFRQRYPAALTYLKVASISSLPRQGHLPALYLAQPPPTLTLRKTARPRISKWGRTRFGTSFVDTSNRCNGRLRMRRLELKFHKVRLRSCHERYPRSVRAKFLAVEETVIIRYYSRVSELDDGNICSVPGRRSHTTAWLCVLIRPSST